MVMIERTIFWQYHNRWADFELHFILSTSRKIAPSGFPRLVNFDCSLVGVFSNAVKRVTKSVQQTLVLSAMSRLASRDSRKSWCLGRPNRVASEAKERTNLQGETHWEAATGSFAPSALLTERAESFGMRLC